MSFVAVLIERIKLAGYFAKSQHTTIVYLMRNITIYLTCLIDVI